MFGADTPLVLDALQMVGAVAAVTAAGVYILMRRKRTAETAEARPDQTANEDNLEQRVRVLERIATDRSIDLADEIEELRVGGDADQSKEGTQA